MSLHTLHAPKPPAPAPWGCRERPSTAGEEAVFVERLRQMTARPSQRRVVASPFQRYDITAVVTALREGVTVDELFRSAPGLRPESVIAAYDHVEQLRKDSVDAWHAIVANPTVASLAENGDRASIILPAVISQLRNLLLRQTGGPLTLATAVVTIDREIRATGERALELEYLLTGSQKPIAARAAELLVGELSDGLWSLGSFLPPRVGTILTARLRGMLEEHALQAARAASAAEHQSAVA